MRCLCLVLLCIASCGMGTRAELSPSSCSVLRTATSIATITPELAQLAMRYYSSSSSASESAEPHHRAKRFLFGENSSKDGVKGSVLEQMVANAFKDVNFTRVALLMLQNNETMNKLRQNVDSEAIIRALMHEIDYDKLGRSLWYAAEADFDLEHFISSVINATHLDVIHDELIVNGTVPEWLIKSIHPELNVKTVDRMFFTLKNLTYKFVDIMSSSERLDDYLFKMIQQQALTPVGNIIQRVKDEKPETLDELVEIVLSNVNKVITEQYMTTTKATTTTKKTDKKALNKPPSATTAVTAESSIPDDVKLLLYQCSVALDTFAQTAHLVLKALEQLYCTSVWE